MYVLSLETSFRLSEELTVTIFHANDRFNPGSTLNIHTAALGDVASLVAVNTTLGAAAG